MIWAAIALIAFMAVLAIAAFVFGYWLGRADTKAVIDATLDWFDFDGSYRSNDFEAEDDTPFEVDYFFIIEDAKSRRPQ